MGTAAFPTNPDLTVMWNDVTVPRLSTAVTYIGQVGGHAHVDPLVFPGQVDTPHEHTFLNMHPTTVFPENVIDAAEPLLIHSVAMHLGQKVGYVPFTWWPRLRTANGEFATIKPDTAVYHVFNPGGRVVAPPAGTGLVIDKSNGIIKARDDGRGVTILGPKWWDGRTRSDNHRSHFSKSTTATHTIPIAQVQIFIKTEEMSPFYFLHHDELHNMLEDEGHIDYVYGNSVVDEHSFLQFLWDLAFHGPAPFKMEALKTNSATPSAEEPEPEPPTLEERVAVLEQIVFEHDQRIEALEQGHPL